MEDSDTVSLLARLAKEAVTKDESRDRERVQTPLLDYLRHHYMKSARRHVSQFAEGSASGRSFAGRDRCPVTFCASKERKHGTCPACVRT